MRIRMLAATDVHTSLLGSAALVSMKPPMTIAAAIAIVCAGVKF